MNEYNTPVTVTLNDHVTIRHFTDQPIPDNMLEAILDAARRSPTSSNMQTYSMIIVRDPGTRRVLAQLANNQKHIETCAVFVAFCADIHRLETAVAMHNATLVKTLETTLVATIDAALVGMSVQTAAESFGLGAVMIGAMRNHPLEAAQLLGLPPGVYVVYGMCLGWPDESLRPPQKPRLPRELVIHQERYEQRDTGKQLANYDRELAAHYNILERNIHKDAWTGPIAKRLQEPVRPHLRAELEALGFSFE
jgi:nitroreductase